MTHTSPGHVAELPFLVPWGLNSVRELELLGQLAMCQAVFTPLVSHAITVETALSAPRLLYTRVTENTLLLYILRHCNHLGVTSSYSTTLSFRRQLIFNKNKH